MIITEPGDSARGRLEAERAEVHAIFVDCGAVPLHLLDERDERAAEGDHIGEAAAAEHARAHLEEVLGGRVDVVDPEALTDDEERIRQRAEQRLGLDRLRLGSPAQARSFG